MKQFNHTDNIFNEKLGNYASNAPMHLWDAIEAKRTWRHRAALLLKRKSGLSALLIIVFAIGGLAWMQQDSQQLVSSFFLPENVENEMIAAAEIPVESEEVKEAKIVPATPIKTIVKQAKTKASLPVNVPEIIPVEEAEAVAVAEEIGEEIVPVENAQTARKIDEAAAIPSNETAPVVLARTEQLVIAAKGPDPDCPKFGKKLGGGDFYVDALVSPDNYFRTLSAKSIESLPYLQERETTETMRIGASGGLRLSWVSKTGLAFRTGIMYTQIAERFNYDNGNEERIEINIIRDDQGNIISTDTIRIFGARHKVTYNRHHLIDIPVMLGYEVNTPKWVFTINSGIYLNLLMRSKGDFMSPQFDPVSFTTDEVDAYDAFENSVGLSLFGSVSANYKLTDNIHLVIEPHFRYYLNSFTKSSYLLEQKYTSVGCLTGLRFKF